MYLTFENIYPKLFSYDNEQNWGGGCEIKY